MNILPKKRWHVRTKENIARVRRDEAEAAEKERQEKLRIDNADREARLNILKQESKKRLEQSTINDIESLCATKQEHINLFADFDHTVKTSNKDHDKEVKEKKEEYEKKIGYLTFLGQDTNEALKKKNWYEVLPETSRFSCSADIKDTYDKLVLRDDDGKPKPKTIDVRDGEIGWKAKQKLDPIKAFQKYSTDKQTLKYSRKSKDKDPVELTMIGKNKNRDKKKKNKRHDKDEKEKKIQELRKARLRREKQEKIKTEMFLSGCNGSGTISSEENTNSVKPKYNSQFNPEFARQNYR